MFWRTVVLARVYRAVFFSILPLFFLYSLFLNFFPGGAAAIFTANRRQLSLVDYVSFAAMRQFGVNDAFAFDKHFTEPGFTVLA